MSICHENRDWLPFESYVDSIFQVDSLLVVVSILMASRTLVRLRQGGLTVQQNLQRNDPRTAFQVTTRLLTNRSLSSLSTT